MNYLYGFHGPGGEHLFQDRPGWIVHTVVLSADLPTDYTEWEEKGIGNIVRLDWGPDSVGTITSPEQYSSFANLCSIYVEASPGCSRWIIGNTPNHKDSWPDGHKISPDNYAECYRLCREAIKRVKPDDEVLVAAIDPWNDRDSIPWMSYFSRIIDVLGDDIDGFAIHASTHGSSHRLIHDNYKLGHPYKDLHWNFQVYEDWCNAIPNSLRDAPVYITECHQGKGTWVNENTGYIFDIYEEITKWNRKENVSKIYCVCLYDWSTLESRDRVLQDFSRAVTYMFLSPIGEGNTPSHFLSGDAGNGGNPASPTNSGNYILGNDMIKQAEYLREEEVILALRSALGNTSIAAASLGLSRGQLMDYIVNHPNVREEKHNIKEAIKDDAEDQLVARMKVNDNLLVFFLRTQARERGYEPNVPLVGADGKSLSVTVDARSLISAMRQGLTLPNGDSENGETEESTDSGSNGA